ncbi:helicase [Aldersonia sp. NBC_00410]|uniref:helicase-related protein n=1 Tax=Aldersonia sp. NBC_00410 TaxID=2975954 RepID=UPI0022541BAC|nr:helicase-related protein [Aldersonia sp. NBC_00410]MCX5042489.1 helicase [Aldersonia sp. NBC_00410]
MAAQNVRSLLPEPVDFRPVDSVLPPSGEKARARANIAAVRMLNRLEVEDRYATEDEQEILTRWSGWGAAAGIFDLRKSEWAAERDELRGLLDEARWAQAQRNTLNAHYTDPDVARAMWVALDRAGFRGGRVLEPGCGSGTFLAYAPPSAQMVGVELDSTTAAIAAALQPSSQIRNEGFETTHVPEGSFTATIGNVPFGDFRLHDPSHNPSRLSIHNHFINKALALTAPGGYVAVLTSRYTMDAVDPRSRREIAARADLVGAVRLPAGAFARVAGTQVVTDILLLRRREDGREMTAQTKSFLTSANVTVLDADGDEQGLRANAYYADHPEHVLGAMTVGRGMYAGESLTVTGTSGPELAEQVQQSLIAIVTRACADGLGLDAGWSTLAGPTREDFERGLQAAADRTDPVTAVGTLNYEAQGDRIMSWSGQRWVEVKTRGAGQVREWAALLELRDVAGALITAQREDLPTEQRDALRAELNRRYDSYVARYGAINRFGWSKVAELTDVQHAKALDKLTADWRRAEGSRTEPYDGPIPSDVVAELSEQAWENPRKPHKTYPHLGRALRTDPGFSTVLALEEFDETTMRATKATLFHTDVLGVRAVRSSADTIEDAMAISLDETARLDLPRIAELLDTTVENVETLMEGKAFRGLSDPHVWIPASRYLSGNVHKKLADATAVAETDTRFRANVDALTEALPPRITGGVSVRPGTGWIPAADYVQFMRDTFAIPADIRVSIEKAAGKWSIEVPYYPGIYEQDMKWALVPKKYRGSTRFNFEWSDAERQGVANAGIRRGDYDWREMFTDLLNSKPIEITKSKEYRDITGGDALHDAATRAAQSRAHRIAQEFNEWALGIDPERTERLLDRYNELFNSVVAPVYDGSVRAFPGLGSQYAPYDYQRNAVARIVSEPTVLLDHVVGAGKSGTMFMGAMELKRLGLVSKPWIVVPNHIVDQLSREAKQWYPGANVLSGAAATDAEMRRVFLAQSASQDWDMVIVPLSVFVRVNVSNSTRIEFIRTQIAALDETKASHDESVKAIEKAKAVLQEKLEDALDSAGKDTGLTFESSGCDYLFIDEAHAFKNLIRASGVQELACSGSDQALDLQMKLGFLRDQRRRHAAAAGVGADEYVERVTTFATGTPVANSLAELWVMQAYLRPDLLADAEVSDIDEWGATFTSTLERVELNASGSRLRPVTRVGEFTNVGDLIAINSVFTDFVGRERVPARLPEKVGGTNEVIGFEPPQEVLDFIADLGWRADHADVARPDIDNALVIANHGRSASLDPRAVHLDIDDPPLMLDEEGLLAENQAGPGTIRAVVVAETMLQIWRDTCDLPYRDKLGTSSPILGGLQVGFCDRATPKSGGEWSIYHSIRALLVEGGMDPAVIRFVHDYPKPGEKAALFEDCRNGRVAVLLGSTEKMGTGTNVQDRIVALHHIDVPWRPADLEQREGRAIRQGNQNPQVRVLNYVAEKTYDTVMWQTVHRKAHFIEQLRRADRSMRRVPDLGADSVAENAALTKALATGDQRYLRQVELDSQVQDLQAQADVHFAQQRSIERDRERLRSVVPAAEERIRVLAAAAPDLQAWCAAEDFVITIDGTRYLRRADASKALTTELRSAHAVLHSKGMQVTRPIGEIAGHSLIAARSAISGELFVSFERLPLPARAYEPDDLYGSVDPKTAAAKASGNLTRIENMAASAATVLAKAEYQLDRERRTLQHLENTPSVDFRHAARLQDLSAELHQLRSELREAENSPEALARHAARAARLDAKGREDGWSLILNPTPALVEELGLDNADEVRELMAERQRDAARLHDQRRQQAVADAANAAQPVVERGIGQAFIDPRVDHDPGAEDSDWRTRPGYDRDQGIDAPERDDGLSAW